MIFSNGYIPSTKRILNFPSFSSQDQMFSTDRECPSCQFFPRPGSLSPCRLCSLLWHWRILACNHQPCHYKILLWLEKTLFFNDITQAQSIISCPFCNELVLFHRKLKEISPSIFDGSMRRKMLQRKWNKSQKRRCSVLWNTSGRLDAITFSVKDDSLQRDKISHVLFFFYTSWLELFDIR